MTRQRFNVRHGNLEIHNASLGIVVVWRWFSGGPVAGAPHTDATWTHRGTISTRPDGRAARWYCYLSRWEKLGGRWAGMGGAASLGYGLAVDTNATIAGLHYGGVSTACLAALYGMYKATDGLVTWRHRKDWVWPVHVVLRHALGLPEGTKPKTYLHIPANFTEVTGEAIRVDLPSTWYGGEDVKGVITTALSSKLALQDVSFQWKLAGRDHYVAVKQAPRPPAVVRFSDEKVRALIEAAREDAPIIGLSHQEAIIAVSLDSESPHILVNAATGGGKSVILRALMAQFMHNGARCVILDRKRHSHKWARGLPQVKYCRDIEEIHNALVELGKEADARNHIVDDWEGPEDEAPVGERILLPLEEANATITKLKKYWQKIRDTDDPKESPAIEALGEILFMGRAVKIHVLLVAQSATANALGGPEMRENFSTRILARYTKNAWNMLVPEVQPAPKSTRHIGRCQVVLGGVAHETQVLFFTPEEARAWALAGAEDPRLSQTPAAADMRPATAGSSPSHVTGHNLTPPLPSRENTADGHNIPGVTDDPNQTVPDGIKYGPLTVLAGGQAAPQQSPHKPEPELYTLARATREGIVDVTHNAIRQAKSRDPEFPEPDGRKGASDLWYAETLQRWERNRPRAAGDN